MQLSSSEEHAISQWDLICQYEDFIFRICCTRLHDEHAAKDATQETLVSAWLHLDQIDGRASTLKAWLGAIAQNKCIDELRRRVRRGCSLEAAIELSTPPLLSKEPSVEDIVLAAEANREIRCAIDNLAEPLRTTLLLCWLGGMAYEEIANWHRVPVGTVKSRVHRARMALRQSIPYKVENG
jgi:RNA polymerase sigma-70 factor (ECF subfamily)